MRVVAAATFVLALLVPAVAVPATGPPADGVISARTGAALYAANCSSCHGPSGQGISTPGGRGVADIQGLGPSLQHAGALAADFYLRTGYMPLANPHEQPERSHVLFTESQLDALVAYVASLGHGPAIPKPDPSQGSLSAGFALFTDHCAGCHQVAAQGGYVTGARVPPLEQATNIEIAEAVRTGPYVMPKFSPRAIDAHQLDSIVRYVNYTKHPDDPGGLGIGRIGPVPEGIVAWLIAGSALIASCLLVSRRARHE